MDFSKLEASELGAVILCLEELLDKGKLGKNTMHALLKNWLGRATSQHLDLSLRDYEEIPEASVFLEPVSPSLVFIGNKAGLHQLEKAAQQARLEGVTRKTCFSHKGGGYYFRGFLLEDLDQIPTTINFHTNLESDEQKELDKFLVELHKSAS